MRTNDVDRLSKLSRMITSLRVLPGTCSAIVIGSLSVAHVGCDDRSTHADEPEASSIVTPPSQVDTILSLLLVEKPKDSTDPSQAIGFPLEEFRELYYDKQQVNLRLAMGRAGQAMVNIERGLMMESKSGLEFALSGFLLLEKSLNDSRAAVSAERNPKMYTYFTACLVLAHYGQLALLQGDEALVADVLLGLRKLRREGHNLFAAATGAGWWRVHWDVDPPMVIKEAA